MDDLSVIVVHHRTPDVLLACLERLERSGPSQIVVVDTAPEAATTARVLERHPHVEVVACANHSYAHAVNTGLARAHGRFLATMNADVYVEPSTFERLAEAFRRDPDTGVAAPLARTPAGRRQDHGPLYHPHYLRLSLRPGGSVRVPWVTGCLQLTTRAAVDRCGGMDPSLRFFNEDVEFCLRLRRAGMRCRLVDTPVLHLGGSSTPPSGAFLVEGARGGYQLSRRYAPAPVRALHRAGLLLWGGLAALAARRPERRHAYRRIARLALDGRFDDDVFGPTLQHGR